MDCRECKRLVGRYLDGEAGPDEGGRIEAHIGECRSCAESLERARILFGVHRGLRDSRPPAELTDRIVAAALSLEREAGAGRGLLAWRGFVAAAAAGIVLLGFFTGSFILRSYLEAPPGEYAEVTGLEYLGDYPPDSLGDAIQVAAGGGARE